MTLKRRRLRKGDRVVATDFTGHSGTWLREGVTYTVEYTVEAAPQRGEVMVKIVGISDVLYESRFTFAHEAVKEETVLGTQVGGSHYTDCAIQPIEYIWANKLGFSEGNIVKYVTRYKAKGGIKDLEKAHHHLALLIERLEKDAKQA